MGSAGAWLLVAGLQLAGGAENTAARAGPGQESCAARPVLPEQIRPLSCELAAAVASGLARSATFGRLVARIVALNGIVYVRPRPIVQMETGRALRGALLHRVARGGSYRLLHVLVTPASRDRTVLVLAHEFQHAIELLEAGVSSEAEADALLERIGSEAGARVVETNAAVEVERVVRRELDLAPEADRTHASRRTRTPGR